MLTTTAATRAAAATGTPTALTPPAATNSTTTPMTAPAPAEATIWDLLRGEQLYRPSSNELVDAASVVGNEQQQNKIVLIYFSAYWCAPCSYFTPILAGLYQTLQQRLGQEQQEQRDNFCAAYPTPCSPSSSLPFEVIYCGMDKTTAQYTRYTQKMPWFCVPFGNQVLTSRLVTHYRANTIPHLVVLDRDGRTVLTNDGVTQVQQDPQGMHFPWRPPPLAAILPRQYLYHRTNSHDNTNGYVSKTETRPFAALRHKHILFYFAAQWCGPCRRTLPFMLRACRKLRAARDDFEFIFVSADKNEREFVDHFRQMPSFGAIPFELAECRQTLVKRFGVQGYPTVLVWSPEGPDGQRRVINPNARTVLEDGGDVVVRDFPYHPGPYGCLKAAHQDMNNHPCVIVFHENGDDEDQKRIRQVLREASRYLACRTKCLWVLEQSHVSETVRQVVGLPKQPDEEARMILLDLPGGSGGFYMSPVGEITVESVVAFCSNPGMRMGLK